MSFAFKNFFFCLSVSPPFAHSLSPRSGLPWNRCFLSLIFRGIAIMVLNNISHLHRSCTL